jgi:DNA-binding PadR family transcriptional regulator
MSNLTKNEEIILLSILRLEDNAYGVSIKNQIEKLTGEEWNYGLLYCALDQLARKGLLIKREGKPIPERGGRRKIYYSISQSGRRALEGAYKLKEALWDGIGVPFLKKGEA